MWEFQGKPLTSQFLLVQYRGRLSNLNHFLMQIEEYKILRRIYSRKGSNSG